MKEKILKGIASNHMKTLSYDFCLGLKIDYFSKVRNMLKIKWFMLGFCIYSLLHDLYMCQFFNIINTLRP
jgi:hypothetical protein